MHDSGGPNANDAFFHSLLSIEEMLALKTTRVESGEERLFVFEATEKKKYWTNYT